jgi:long-subunit fatty acid transport protein
VNVTGNGTGVGYHVGGQFKVNKYLSFGARYLSRQLVKINDGTAEITPIQTGLTTAAPIPTSTGDTIKAGTPYDALVAPQFADGGALSTQAGSTYLRLPNQLVLGLAFSPTDRAKLLFDYQYTYWGVFNVLQLNFERLGTRTQREAFRGTRTFRVGGEYALTPTSAVRAGWYTHGGAAPAETVTPLLPEGPRSSFTAGIGTNLGRSLHVDVSYQYIAQADRQGRTTDGGTTAPTAAVNNGLYNFHAHLVGATLAYAF